MDLLQLGMMWPLEPKYIKHTGRKVTLPKERTRVAKDTTKDPYKFVKRGKVVNRAYWKKVAIELIEKAVNRAYCKEIVEELFEKKLDLATKVKTEVKTVEVDLTDSDVEDVDDDVEILLL